MGGYGALMYAAHRPAMFRAVTTYSGPVHLLHPDSVVEWRTAFQVAPASPALFAGWTAAGATVEDLSM